jgi:hypothetical protein
MVFKWIMKEQGGSMDWIHLPQDRVQWWALMNAIKNLWVA